MTITTTDVIDAGRHTGISTAVVAETAAKATPKQRQLLLDLFTAEHASRAHQRRTRLLKAAKLPTMKTLDGYDWTNIKFPTDYGRTPLIDLEFLAAGSDLVFYGDVGCGKTHLAIALAAHACHQGIPARFFTTASLVTHLRRAADQGRLDKELGLLGKNRLLIIDEFGYLPIDTDGARLLFQVIADAYEKRSLILTTNLEFARWGGVFGDDNMAAAIIDRIVHHGRLLHFTGQSYRVTNALMQ